MLNSLRSWMVSLRVWSFPISAYVLALSLILNEQTSGQDAIQLGVRYALCCLIVFAVHGAGNLVNSYYDFVNNVDVYENASDRTLIDNICSPLEVRRLYRVLYTLAASFSIALVALTPGARVVMIILFGVCSYLSYAYTGQVGLKYRGLGEVVVTLCFGPLLYAFASTSLASRPNCDGISLVAPLVIQTNLILHSNNIRDLDSDQRAGITTLSILLGDRRSRMFYCFLQLLTYATVGVETLIYPTVGIASVCAFMIRDVMRQSFSVDGERLFDATVEHATVFGVVYIGSLALGRHLGAMKIT